VEQFARVKTLKIAKNAADEYLETTLSKGTCMNKIVATTPTELTLKIETHDLTPMQIRLLKHAHTLLVHVVSADDESEYFEASAQLLKQAVQLIKHSNFPETNKDGIAYGEQAIEYAVEELNEALSENRHINIDN
jgi:hypothetical protein